MKKLKTKNKTRGLLGFFATLALTIGIGVSLSSNNVHKAKAQSTTHSFKSSIPSGWTLSFDQSGFDDTRGAQFLNKSFTSMTLTYASTDSFSGVDITSATNGTANKTKIKVHIGNEQLGVEQTLTQATNKEYSFSGSTLSGNIVITISTTNTDKSTYVLQVVTHLVNEPGDSESSEPNDSGSSEPGGSGEQDVGEINITASEMGYTTSYKSVTKEIDGVTFTSSNVMKDNSNNMQFAATSGTFKNDTEVPGDIIKIIITQTTTYRAFTVSSGPMSSPLAGQGSLTSGTMEWNLTGEGHRYFSITRGANAAYVTNIKIIYNTTPPTPVESISVSPNEATIYANGTNKKAVQLSATVLPEDANQKVTWQSSNTAIATVDSNGLVTAVNGNATPVTITATTVGLPTKTATASITVIAKALNNISVIGTPTTKQYYKGENFNLTGLTVTGTYNNTDTEIISSGITISPTPLTSGTTEVTLSYGGKQTTVSGITVLDRELVALQKGGTLTKSDYYVGETFNKAGLTFTAVYSDGHTEDVTSEVTLSTTAIVAGLDEIEVSYELVRNYPLPVTVKTSITEFTVTEVVLNNITIKTPATKTTFSLGEEFSHAGLVINANYNSGTVEKVDGFTVSEFDTMVLGMHTVSIGFGGETVNYNVKVTNEGADLSQKMTDLIISEYVEGSGNNKYIEIFNGTGKTVDLSDYKVSLYANGASTATSTEELEGELTNNKVIIIKNSGATLAMPNGVLIISSNVANFNGDDAIAIIKISTGKYVDIFGKIGQDPGNAWSSGGITTLDQTLVRKTSILSGVTSNPATFNPSLEWTEYPIDTVSNLGSHEFAGIDGALPQATAFANFVMTGRGFNAEGQCQAVYDDLLEEYNFMSEDAQLEFATNPDALFVNARARIDYLEAFLGIGESEEGFGRTLSIINKVDSLSVALVVGITGLTTLAGYHFLQKEKGKNN